MVPAQRLRAIGGLLLRRDRDKARQPLLRHAHRRIVFRQLLHHDKDVEFLHILRGLVPSVADLLGLVQPMLGLQRQRVTFIGLGVASSVGRPGDGVLKPAGGLRGAFGVLQKPAERLRAAHRFFRCHHGGKFVEFFAADHARGVRRAQLLRDEAEIEAAQDRRLVAPLLGQRYGFLGAVKLLQRQRIAFRRLDLRLCLQRGLAVGLCPVEAVFEPGQRAGKRVARKMMPAERLRALRRFRRGDEAGEIGEAFLR